MSDVGTESVDSKLNPVKAIVILFLLVALTYWFFQFKNTETVASVDEFTPNIAAVNTLPSGKVESVDVLLEGLRSRLEQQPNDMKGWVLLAKSYHHLQRWQESDQAFDKAKALGYEGEAPKIASGTSVGVRNMNASAYRINGFNNKLLARQLEQLIVVKPKNNQQLIANTQKVMEE
jgi:hypothetical protein